MKLSSPIWLIAGTILAAGPVVLAVAAWRFWPPALQYRLTRNEGQMRVVVSNYLNGRTSFDDAAAQLGRCFARAQLLISRLPFPSVSNGELRIEKGAGIAPPGYSENDPRIDSLARRAFVLSAPPGLRKAAEEMLREHR